jgi:chemotaxis protein methyltransferase CheR
LSRDIERVCGIEITGIMEAKLGRVLASVALPALEAWVSRLHHLPGDDPEWLSLIESLTVHETFFHRDQSQLDLLRRRLLPEVIEAAARGGRYRLHLWSAGCATGEEAYTLSILVLLALRDAGFAQEAADQGIVCRAPWQIDVLGSDISRVVLTRAEAATYPAQELGAFRQLPGELDRFFPPLPPNPDAPDRLDGLVELGDDAFRPLPVIGRLGTLFNAVAVPVAAEPPALRLHIGQALFAAAEASCGETDG